MTDENPHPPWSGVPAGDAVQRIPDSVGGPETGDLSSRTVLVLVVLTLVISFIGAWTNISRTHELAVANQPTQQSASAQVSFTIKPPGSTPPATATGMAFFNVQNPESSG